MHNQDDQELSAREREAFAALPREQMPSRLLEERVVTELRARGYSFVIPELERLKTNR